VAAKVGTKRGLPSLFDDWDDRISTGNMTEKELSSTSTNTKQADNDLASLKQSIDNHGKSIEAAARIKCKKGRKQLIGIVCLRCMPKLAWQYSV
jgi:hypothetical protein